MIKHFLGSLKCTANHYIMCTSHCIAVCDIMYCETRQYVWACTSGNINISWPQPVVRGHSCCCSSLLDNPHLWFEDILIVAPHCQLTLTCGLRTSSLLLLTVSWPSSVVRGHPRWCSSLSADTHLWFENILVVAPHCQLTLTCRSRTSLLLLLTVSWHSPVVREHPRCCSSLSADTHLWFEDILVVLLTVSWHLWFEDILVVAPHCQLTLTCGSRTSSLLLLTVSWHSPVVRGHRRCCSSLSVDTHLWFEDILVVLLTVSWHSPVVRGHPRYCSSLSADTHLWFKDILVVGPHCPGQVAVYSGWNRHNGRG